MDLLQIVNDLKAAGAEAISVSGQRVISMTEVRCSGPIIKINGVGIASPFEVQAVGDPEVLESALALPGGIKGQLEMMGIRITVSKNNEVQVSPLAVTPNLRFAVPTKPEQP